jgi:AraC-like DNA-binding protein
VYSPRPEHCLVFYLRELQNIGYWDSPKLQIHPKCTINGQHTIVTNRYNGRDFFALQIVLQPSALFRLTGIPSYELTNTFIDAEAVWGKDIRTAHEQMCNSEDMEEIIKIAESFLEKIIRQSKRNLHSVDKVSSLILNQHQPLSIDRLADQACLSPRQFYRKFTERMGIGPKLFDKVVRFERAFRMKNAYPHLDWLSIAIACGYYDHQHLAKDYNDFTHLSPSAFYEADTKAPERNFGLKET